VLYSRLAYLLVKFKSVRYEGLAAWFKKYLYPLVAVY
jgi:hypothetical protein